jgi:hypothetical protein
VSAHGLRPAEQPVGRHRDPVAADDRVGRGDRERSGQEAGRQHVDARPDEEERTAEPHPELEQQDRSDRQETAHERRQERAEHQAGAKHGDERSDLTARQTLPLAQDDDREQQARANEVREPVKERACTQERPVPQEAKAFCKPRTQRGEVGLALLLERCPHRKQRESRERVRDCIDDERERAREPEERTPERRPGQLHRCLTARLGAHGCR